MSPDSNIEILNTELERLPEPPQETPADFSALNAAAAELSRRMVWLPGTHSYRFFADRLRALRSALNPVVKEFHGPLPKNPVGEDFRWMYDNLRLLHSDLRGMKEGFKLVRSLPHVRTPEGAVTPRVLVLAAGFLAATGYEFSEAALRGYVQAFQQSIALRLHELWALVPALKMVLLEEIAARGSKVLTDAEGSTEWECAYAACGNFPNGLEDDSRTTRSFR